LFTQIVTGTLSLSSGSGISWILAWQDAISKGISIKPSELTRVFFRAEDCLMVFCFIVKKI
jgi:hypothetical protein